MVLSSRVNSVSAQGTCLSRKGSAAESQNEAEESDESEDGTAGERTTRVGRTRGGMKVAARIGWRETAKREREIGRGRRPRVGDG